MDAVARAVADPVRRRILDALGERPRSAGDVAALFPVSRPAISRHLRVLRESGLVVDRAEGRRRVYALDPTPLAPLQAWLAGVGPASTWESRLDALDLEVRRTRRDRSRSPKEQTA